MSCTHVEESVCDFAQVVTLLDDRSQLSGLEQLSQDMRDKRALLMKAYNEWKEALGFQQAYWATAAGYEEVYQRAIARR